MPDTFQALLLTESGGKTTAAVQRVNETDLPQGDVTIDVAYSSLNYKDGLAVTGRGKVVRRFPMVPGIDLAGVVRSSDSQTFRPGDPVVLTGWGIGEKHWGGYAQRARVPSDWLLPLPEGITLKQSMVVGTAGLTAMLCVMALEEHGLSPDAGEVVVTGGGGGVGSVAIALLAASGYRVTAVTGREELAPYLRELGATAVEPRSTLTDQKRPLAAERWAGAVDTAGGSLLAGILSSLRYGASAAACGLAAGMDLPASVAPFILRGTNLLGIDSVQCPAPRRRVAWKRLAKELPREKVAPMSTVIPLADVPAWSEKILAGQVRGRVVVDVNA